MSGDPWPDYIMRSFAIANRKAEEPLANESLYYGPYTRVLYEILGWNGPFEVSPQFTPSDSSRDAIVALVTVQLDNYPIFFIQVKLPGLFRYDSKRAKADAQMRECYSDLRDNLITGHLPGVSAFGTRMAFYHYDRDTGRLEPRHITPDPDSFTNLAPKNRWDADLLTHDGAARFRQIVEQARDAALAAASAGPT